MSNQIPAGYVPDDKGGYSKPAKGKPSVVEMARPDFIFKPSTDEAKLNKTEKAYLAHLRALNVPHIGIQDVTVKIANDCRLTPDFSYVDSNGRFTLVDVKGFQREDALIKIKVAARKFSLFRFVIVKRSGNCWDEKDVLP